MNLMIILLFPAVIILWCLLPMCLITAWRLRHMEEPHIYVWPVPGRPVAEQLEECGALAASIQTLRKQDIARFTAMWESGLGKEFPSMGRN